MRVSLTFSSMANFAVMFAATRYLRDGQLSGRILIHVRPEVWLGFSSTRKFSRPEVWLGFSSTGAWVWLARQSTRPWVWLAFSSTGENDRPWVWLAFSSTGPVWW